MGEFLLFWIIQLFVFLTGIAVGHSILLYKIRRQEGRNRELEIQVMDKRKEVLNQGKLVASNIEEAIFKARLQQEIEDMMRREKPGS